ncbi:hypothetical protein SDC9_160233 [bioreactor metagenome]|uniref:Secretion system C-terminal sorting domain-containing protein n=1 Tax=bioreactor metagenome TaxID=1076179 RepID=A0A645FL31_9ZZZZ
MSIAPNPVNDVVSISFNSESTENMLIDICSLTGSTIATIFDGAATLGHNKLDFNLANMKIATGTYMIKITNSKGMISKQFLFIK